MQRLVVCIRGNYNMSKEYNYEKEQLAQLIKRVRAYANLTQKDLSAITGITQADISKMERGVANPSIRTVSKIMEATGSKLLIDFEINTDAGNFIVDSWRNVDSHIVEVSTESARLAKEAMEEDAEAIVLYGSCARGENTENSDVDIAILTKCDRVEAKKYSDKLSDISANIMAKYFEVVNFVCLPLSEYLEKKAWYPLFMNIEKDGIFVYGRR